jgi:hypothetical protein
VLEALLYPVVKGRGLKNSKVFFIDIFVVICHDI